jgi:hypothetical protein
MQWAVTVTFYSALHALGAYLLTRGIQVTSHRARDRVISNPVNGVPANIYRAYRDLEDYSRDARYDLLPFASQEVRDLLGQQLAAI